MTAGGSIGHAARDLLLDGRAFNQLHAVKAESIAFPDFIDWYDVGMVETRRRAGLQSETLPSVRAREVSRRNCLQSHDTSQTAMTRAIHHALAPTAQFAEKLVVAERWGRGGLLRGSETGRGLGAGRVGIGINGAIEQAAETEVVRRRGRDNRSATVASAGEVHGI